MEITTAKKDANLLRVFFDGIPHLIMGRLGFILMDSDYQTLSKSRKEQGFIGQHLYSINLHYWERKIVLEYDDREVWETMLKLIDNFIQLMP